MSLPAADDLFRPTARTTDDAATEAGQQEAEPIEPVGAEETQVADDRAAGDGPAKDRRPSGRVRHDEKMTVYVTADELLDLEHARLVLRRHQGLAVDRGRLVREAVAIALADLEANGEDSVIVQRLKQS